LVFFFVSFRVFRGYCTLMFTPHETAACQRLVAWALEEDLGSAGDLTSQAVLPADLAGRAVFVPRSPGVLAGLPAVALVAAAVDPGLVLQPLLEDGARLEPGRQLAVLSGPMRALLAAERTALNFLQHLSGVATLTRRYVDAVAGLPCRILDTRKTTPGWRLLEKYAVRCGGGHNHRLGLADGILIKDNHLAALEQARRQGDKETRRQGEGSLNEAVRLARVKHGAHYPLEIEVDNLQQLDVVLEARPDIVLLDNMPPDVLREAVARRNRSAPEVLLEASGGVTLDTLRAVAETGVDRISIGALTHSAPALDIGLDYLR
jgi:nicotinate-nucleotide pyrophosphorylase (carboxylating)